MGTYKLSFGERGNQPIKTTMKMFQLCLLLMILYAFCLSSIDPKCQDGFRLTPGDIRGIGNLGHLITTYKVCADLCSGNHQCCSYEYSQEKGKCNLNKACHPDRPQWRDQIFCAKRVDPRLL